MKRIISDVDNNNLGEHVKIKRLKTFDEEEENERKMQPNSNSKQTLIENIFKKNGVPIEVLNFKWKEENIYNSIKLASYYKLIIHLKGFICQEQKGYICKELFRVDISIKMIQSWCCGKGLKTIFYKNCEPTIKSHIDLFKKFPKCLILEEDECVMDVCLRNDDDWNDEGNYIGSVLCECSDCNPEQFEKKAISLSLNCMCSNCIEYIQDREEQIINECNCERHYSNGELDLIYDIFKLANHPFTEHELNNVVTNLNYI
jgi:hypothetical protein